MNVLQAMEGASRTASTSWGPSHAGVAQGTAWQVTEELALVSTACILVQERIMNTIVIYLYNRCERMLGKTSWL